MNKNIFTDKISTDFFNYLSSLGISEHSLKFYRSDFFHFSGWLHSKFKTWGIITEEFSQVVPFLTQELASDYKKHLIEKQIPSKTVNRRLSTLRHLGKFLLLSEILPFNFSIEVTNLSLNKDKNETDPIVTQFEKHLREKKVSPNTIKNYLSDIRQFVSWLENQPNYQ